MAFFIFIYFLLFTFVEDRIPGIYKFMMNLFFEKAGVIGGCYRKSVVVNYSDEISLACARLAFFSCIFLKLASAYSL